MVGLSIVLESYKSGSSSSSNNKKPPQVINKATMIINKSCSPSSLSPSTSSSIHSFRTNSFLEQCFLCQQKLLPGKDIYMYKGDRAFCSVECRCKQIILDEEECLRKDNSSMAARKPDSASSSS
ncbi:DUF581 domain-containing protein [Cephalotus follicularis]|uniref:DUF581 domain-containing protein n=1 Tax=Cephalotus follicularis TaxID=3775 RepID=A0A1Q3B897_CEPFO|nr:DUF581 domain-containing protein [Cephalotus follicularis]